MVDALYTGGCGCRPTIKITDTGCMSTYEKLCYVIEKVEEVIVFVNSFQAQIDDLEERKEDSINITNVRKLSENGDFTGTLCAGLKSACDVVAQIDSNRDEINFLVNQFEDGATGLVIECGFFGDDDIDKNYDGGNW